MKRSIIHIIKPG